MDKVSVALTTFNNLPYLKLCLRSLLKYSLPETEILIHVDGSVDGTSEWLEKEGFNYVFEKHQGCYHGFNEAISRASGEYIALFADDMVVSPNWDKNLLKHASKYRVLAARLVEPVFGSMPPIKDFGSPDTFDEKAFLSYAKEISVDELVKWGTPASNFFSHDLFRELGGYDEKFAPYGLGDTDLLFRFKTAYPEMEFLYCKSSIIYHFRNASKSKFSKEAMRETNERTHSHFLQKWGATLQDMHQRLGI